MADSKPSWSVDPNFQPDTVNSVLESRPAGTDQSKPSWSAFIDSLIQSRETPASAPQSIVLDDSDMGYIKIPVRVATLGDFTPTGAATIQGVTLVNGDRVLIGFGASNPVAAQFGGVWLVNTGGPWTRAIDALTWDLLLPGTIVAVREGDYHGQIFVHTTDPGNWNSGSLGTTVQIWNTDVDQSTNESVANKATLQAIDASVLADGTSRYVQTYRDRFDLDKTTTRTAVADVVLAASGGTGWWWVRRIDPDPTWSTQLAWTINPSTGSDENLGNGSFPLKTRAEFFRRMKNATLSSTVTVTVTASLDPSDTYTSKVNTTFSAQLAWVGVPTLLFTGTVSDYVARNGATSQPTQMGIAGIPSSWTASGLVDKIIEWTDGAGNFIRSVVVADLGALLNGHPTAWLSPPINQNSSAGVVFTIGQTVKVYDMPSVNEHVHDTTIESFSYLRASRWTFKSGLSVLTNCIGICSVYGGTSSWSNCNTLPGPDDGNHNITGLTGTASILGGKHSLIGSMDFRVGGPVTVETVRPELGGTCETHITSGVSGDLEVYNVSPNRPAIFLGTLNGGRLVCSGYVYGFCQTVTDAIQVQGRSQKISLAHAPVITNAPNITLSFAGLTVPATILNTQSIEDNFDNLLIGPFGRSPSASVANNAALAALDVRALTEGTSRYVLTYRDWFDLDKTTTRTAVADEVVATNVSGAWWVRRMQADPSWLAQAAWKVDPVGGNDEGLGDSGHPLKTRSEFARRTWGQALTQDMTVTIASSLNAGDSRIPNITSWPASFFSLTYTGVPVSLFTGVITGYTARNGAAAQPTLMTIASLSGTWSNSGTGGVSLVDKLVEWTDGAGHFVRAVVVADMGGKTAWLSPPQNETLAQNPVFTVGQTVNVYSVPSLTNTYETIRSGSVVYNYLSSPNWWIFDGNVQFFQCVGPADSYGGHAVFINHSLGPLPGSLKALYADAGSTFSIAGGKTRIIGATNSAIRINRHSAFFGDSTASPNSDPASGLSAEGNSLISAIGDIGGGHTVDVEYLGGRAFIQSIDVNTGTVALNGYCYGTIGAGTEVISFYGRCGTVSLAQVPSFGGVTGIGFARSGTTGSTADLTIREVSDSDNNRVIGPAGPTPLLSVANNAALAAIDASHLGEGASRFVLTYRDWFALDKTTARTAVADNIVAATGGVGWWWVRRRQPDPSWVLQTAWTVDPASGNDENLGDSGHPLKTLSEYHLRLWGAQLAADHTVTVNSSLNAGDSLQPFFVTNENGLNFTRYPHYVGVQRVVFSGTIDALGVVARNGATNTAGSITVTGIPSTWTAGDGVTSFVGLMVRRPSDGSSARIVKDLGGKQAWISQPILASNSTPVTWSGGDAITVYDVPSLGQEVSPHAGISKYTDLKVTGRWILQTGTLDMRNCAGDCLIQAGTFCYNENGLSGVVSGASFLVSGGIGSIAGGYHRFDCRSGEIGFNITPTIKRILCEGSGIVTCQTGTGPQGTSDFEICQDAASTSPPLQLGGVCGGRIAVLGFCYGLLLNTNALVQFVAIDSSVTFTNNPTCTGTLATQIVYSIAGLTDTTTALATRQSNDTHGNRVIGTAGSSPNAVANGATALALGSTGPAGLPTNPVRYATWPDGAGGFFTIPSWT